MSNKIDKLLVPFLEHPETQYHIRGLSKLTNISPTTTSKYLSLLKKEQILTSQRKFNHLFYRANNQNSLFKQHKLFFNLKKLHQSGLINELNESFNHPSAIILFGSFAKAENISRSDIDILVITPLKKQLSLEKFEKKLGHQVQIFTHSVKEIKLMTKKKKQLLNSWVNGIVLSGYWVLFK